MHLHGRQDLEALEGFRMFDETRLLMHLCVSDRIGGRWVKNAYDICHPSAFILSRLSL
jgi:hypothetical protein